MSKIGQLYQGGFGWSFVLVGLLIFPLGSCMKPEPKGDPVSYANLKQITADFIAEISNQQIGLRKLVSEPGKTDTVWIEHPNWTAELAPFQGYDLAHPVLKGRYHVDSITVGNRTRIRYRATGGELPLRVGVLMREGDRPVWFRMIDSTDNIMYHSVKSMFLHLDSGYYRMDVEQESWLFKPLEEHIQGQKWDVD